jgi:hypothetical protein
MISGSDMRLSELKQFRTAVRLLAVANALT